MNMILNFGRYTQSVLDKAIHNTAMFSLLLLRVYLVPVFWFAGKNKRDPLRQHISGCWLRFFTSGVEDM